jgi:glyoxylase-like metal-dependent hydrolase (beta-lactamase superfamily II)
MLSDVELPMPDPADEDLDTYVTGLEALRAAVLESRWVVPGHGSPTSDPRGRLEADLRYLDDLLCGRTSSDPRVQDPENADLHAANLARARRSRGLE